ncbi:DUF4345 family protein [Tenacibaculum amylolyticum]|uniref:DUF4345 family protein n=1 Tax=Tenacibaculum amylolyticum TaxID=104269 RepID=UPI003894FFC6
MEIIKTITLLLSGLLLLFVGIMRLSNPVGTYLKNSGIKLDKDVNLLNEIRGVSAVQLLSSICIIVGIFVTKLTVISFAIASIVFIGFLIGRLTSIQVDGKPNKQIIQGLRFELLFGIANLFCLIYVLT